MRVAFLGNAPWSVPSLEALAGSEHQVAVVVTRVPKPAGRGSMLTPTAVADAARRLGLPLVEAPTVKSGPGFEALADAAPDVLAVVAYGEIVPRAVLDIPRVAPVNVHFSLLPKLRGAAPVQRALMEGMTLTGVTTIRMDEGMDTGPILLRAEEAIHEEDDAGSLGERLAAMGGRLLVDTLDRLEAGALHETLQDDALATLAPKVKPAERVIDWTSEGEAILRRVRGLAPQPAATTLFRGKVLKIFRAAGSSGQRADEASGPPARRSAQNELVRTAAEGAGEPGSVTVADRRGLAVGAGDGLVWLREVAPEGRKRMSGAEFVRGYRPEVGERLG